MSMIFSFFHPTAIRTRNTSESSSKGWNSHSFSSTRLNVHFIKTAFIFSVLLFRARESPWILNGFVPSPNGLSRARTGIFKFFLGFCNLYRRFIYRYSSIAAPLNHLLKGSVKGKKPGSVELTDVEAEAFHSLVGAFQHAPVFGTSILSCLSAWRPMHRISHEPPSFRSRTPMVTTIPWPFGPANSRMPKLAMEPRTSR